MSRDFGKHWVPRALTSVCATVSETVGLVVVSPDDLPRLTIRPETISWADL